MFDATEFTAGSHPVDRRREPRRRALLQGKVLFVKNNLTCGCLIRNISAYGARITLKDVRTCPTEAVLVVVKTGMAHDATTIWSSPDECGVRFETSHDLRRDPPARLNHAHRLWIENLPR